MYISNIVPFDCYFPIGKNGRKKRIESSLWFYLYLKQNRNKTSEFIEILKELAFSSITMQNYTYTQFYQF